MHIHTWGGAGEGSSECSGARQQLHTLVIFPFQFYSDKSSSVNSDGVCFHLPANWAELRHGLAGPDVDLDLE
jgi:hypothetical protein